MVGQVGVCGFCNITVNLTQLCAFFGLNYSNLIVMHGMENTKYCIRCVKCGFEISLFRIVTLLMSAQ
jgi:hypothetical protein